MKRQSISALTYLGLIAVLVVVQVLFTFAPVDCIVPAQAVALTWQAVIVAAVLGFVGLVLARKTGFPTMWDAQISNKQRFLIPALVGLGAGTLILVLFGLVQPLNDVNVEFPLSIPFYLYGGIFSEILYRLFPIPLFVWLISSALLKNRWQEQVFWLIAVLTSLLEPLGQAAGLAQSGASALSLALGFGIVFGINLLAAYLFRKSGFLALLAMRLSLYSVLHIVGGLI